MSLSNRNLFGLVALIFAALGCVSLAILLFSSASEKQPTINEPPPASPSPSASQNTKAHTVDVDARRVWTDTSIQVNRGDRIDISASGQVNVASPGNGADKWVGPEGWGYVPLLHCGGQPCRYVYRTADSLGCLIGKIGTGKPFTVNSRYSASAETAGRLYLSVNDAMSEADGKVLDDSNAGALMFSNNRGSFTAVVQITSTK